MVHPRTHVASIEPVASHEQERRLHVGVATLRAAELAREGAVVHGQDRGERDECLRIPEHDVGIAEEHEVGAALSRLVLFDARQRGEA